MIFVGCITDLVFLTILLKTNLLDFHQASMVIAAMPAIASKILMVASYLKISNYQTLIPPPILSLQYWGVYPLNFRATTQALCPPNPNELFMITSISISRGVLGT